jgi:hypothetical protein
LRLQEGALITVDVGILGGGDPDSVRLILLEDAHNPPGGFGAIIGTDSDGGDGWSITFDPGDFGLTDWGGVLVAEAYFPGHDLETDGDVALINAATSMATPAMSGRGMVTVAVLILATAALLVLRRELWRART